MRFHVVLAGVAVALAAGPSASNIASGAWGWSPFDLLARVPGVNLFRVPARFTVLTTLAVATLAAVGCAGIHRRFGRRGRAVTLVAIPLFLLESYVVRFPGGGQPVFPIPRLYAHLAQLPPGPVLSLPDYAGTPEWFEEANYQLFSTAHWHPIANGYSRSEPPGFRRTMDRLRQFPEPDALAAIREIGIVYVVFHAGKYGASAVDLIARARSHPDVRLLATAGDDYLFAIGRGR
jgi:hypothetical protein